MQYYKLIFKQHTFELKKIFSAYCGEDRAVDGAHGWAEEAADYEEDADY